MITVTTIRDNVVNETKVFYDVKDAEESFTIEALNLGAKKEDMESHIEDGYYSTMNTSVCLVHPEVLKRENTYIINHEHKYGTSTRIVKMLEEPSIEDCEYFFDDFEPEKEEEITIHQHEKVYTEDEFYKIVKNKKES